MFAISFDLNIEALKKHYSETAPKNAYRELGKHFNKNGFHREQGSMYYGDESVTILKTTMVIVGLKKEFPWLKECCTGLRHTLIVEENALEWLE